jgi:hypothetical protein
MRFRLFSLLAVFLLAAQPVAANTWTDCNGNTSGELYRITGYNLVCVDWDDSDGADTRVFFVGAISALICFDPALDSEGPDTATVKLRYCPNGHKPAANPENECFSITTNAITGIQGDPGTQDACQRVGPGAYYMEEVADGGGSDESRLTIQGEGAR